VNWTSSHTRRRGASPSRPWPLITGGFRHRTVLSAASSPDRTDSHADGTVAVWVAVQYRAAAARADRSGTLVQPEPIRTTTTRAANAAHKYSTGVQQRPPTVASKHDRQHTELAGTTTKRPAAPLVRDEEARARRVPDGAVAREVSRPLADNGAGIATWLDAGEPNRGGDLTRKRSLVQIQYGPLFSNVCLTVGANGEPET
jgi:hypothetical protein